MEGRVSRSALIAESREWIGTPYRHGVCAKGHGSDCVGFALTVFQKFGLVPDDIKLPRIYPMEPESYLLQRYLDKYLVRAETIEPGFVGLFKFKTYPQHLCIFSTIDKTGLPGMIHASLLFKRIVEHHYSDEWQHWFVGAYKPHQVFY